MITFVNTSNKKNKPTAIIGEWNEKSIKMAVKVNLEAKNK